jgi:hypothetical protein
MILSRQGELHLLDVRDSIKATTDRIAQADILTIRACRRPDVQAACHHAAPSWVVAKGGAVL